MNSLKRQNDRILKGEPRVGRCPICKRDQWKNNSRKNEGMEPKQKQYPIVDVTRDQEISEVYQKEKFRARILGHSGSDAVNLYSAL